jgi:poly(A) polymerase
VVRRLTRAGHEAYLVGGCVRDLLLDRAPKDFDVATSARPEDVRALFRNSRIIGRRFRLVHVLFANRKVIEVATFRQSPKQEERDEAGNEADLLIRSDNAFGTVEEDALRRDFTINALFYDLDRREILDFAFGMRDIERRAVRTIGDPVVRFREDPVRILRVVKFAAKLDLGVDPDVVDAILVTRDTLRQAAKPRLFEEILRLMRGGASRRGLFLAWEMGLLHVLLPELAAMLDDIEGDEGPSARVFGLLRELDRRTQERGEPFDDVVLWTLLLLEPLIEACDGAPDRMVAAIELCEPIAERLAVHRRIADSMRRIVAVLPRLRTGRLGRFARTELFDQALAVAEISMSAAGDREGLTRLRKAVDAGLKAASLPKG